MRYLTSISLALIVLMALACTATPTATLLPTATPAPNFNESEILALLREEKGRNICLRTAPYVDTSSVHIVDRRAYPFYPKPGVTLPTPAFPEMDYHYQVVPNSFWKEVDVSYKRSGVWLVIAKAGWKEDIEAAGKAEGHGSIQTISDSCVFRLDDTTGDVMD